MVVIFFLSRDLLIRGISAAQHIHGAMLTCDVRSNRLLERLFAAAATHFSCVKLASVICRLYVDSLPLQ